MARGLFSPPSRHSAEPLPSRTQQTIEFLETAISTLKRGVEICTSEASISIDAFQASKDGVRTHHRNGMTRIKFDLTYYDKYADDRLKAGKL